MTEKDLKAALATVRQCYRGGVLHGSLELGALGARFIPKAVQEIRLLRKVVEAAWKELEFTYSHPMAADQGEVWTERKKVSELYKALKEWEVKHGSKD